MSDLLAGGGGSILMIVVMLAVFYFLLIRPQQKEQKKKKEMLSAMQVGDTVMTTSGFYGVLIDISDENTVIVEFGNNRNCRIPMAKAAISAVERPGNPVAEAKASVSKKDDKESIESSTDNTEVTTEESENKSDSE